MPPKGRRCRAPAAHVLCSPVKANTKICDTFKRRFVVEEEIAQGGFGRIYSAHQEDGTEYNKKGSLVVKVEPQANGPLFTEMHVFQRILQPQMLSDWAKSRKCKHLGLPPHLSSGIMKQGQTSLRYLIMPRYAESLEDMRNKNGGRLPADVVFTVAKHCCNSLSYMQEMVG
ncbi:hypothetical protein AB6A40_010793 [Gnathostoma spinigerum]|uniref:Uncharacterized protein n=1 Tax=Gnathostoma spinigerum TaxID=75299 RepID=A0ABD6F0J0_9BILA